MKTTGRGGYSLASFPGASSRRLIGRQGGSSSIKNVVHILSCFLIVLCSMSHALYENGGPLVSSSIRDAPKTSLNSHEHHDDDGTYSPPPDPDRLVWEYLVKKYSASSSPVKSLTSAELLKLVRSMQKCSEADKNEGTNQFARENVQVSQHCGSVIDTIGGGGGAAATNVYNQSSFAHICQRLLYYVENPECCASSNSNNNNKLRSVYIPDSQQSESIPSSSVLADSRNSKKEKPSSSEVWGYGFLLVTIISCSSLVGVSLMPFMAKDFYKHLLTVMIGLAVGSLTGSAVFHLLPQALRLDENDPNHEYLTISLVVVGGIWLFFMVERILKFIMDYKERKGKNWKREKMSSVLSSTPESSTIAVMTENGNLIKGPLVDGSTGEQRNSLMFPATPRDTGVIYECQEQVIKASFGHQEKPRLSSCHDHQVTFEQGKDSVIATVAWMIIFGDGLHNFIDGLSIGAAFNESIWTGVSISVAVLCEELPHELGDFAVLLNAGMSMRQAVTYNFLSACTCYIGMAVGILLGEIEASSYIFALAGGMFLYISLVDMVPEMNEIAQETSKVSVKSGLITLLLQNLGLMAGITALFLLAKYQDSFQF